MTSKRGSQKTAPDADFRRLFIKVAVTLAVVVGILFALTLMSGPRLRHAEVDAKAVTTDAGQRLTLYANQPLAKLPSSNVSVEPAVQFGVTNSANTITVTFKQKLQYHTRYRVTVKDVAPSQGSSRQARFSYEFTTADPNLYYLQRAGHFNRTDQVVDKVMRTALSGRDETVIYQAKRIQAFTVVGDRLAVVTVNDDHTNDLLLVDVETGQATPVKLPASGKISQLRSSPDGKKYGFRFTGQQSGGPTEYLSNLFVHDLTPGRNLVPLDGLTGQPLQILDWQFSNDGTAIIAQQFDTNLLLLDMTFKHLPAPLGQYASMNNLSYDGTKLAVRRQVGFAVLDIPERQLLTANERVPQDLGVPVDVRLLSNQAGEVLHARRNSDGTEKGLVVLLREAGRSIVYEYDPTEHNLISYGMTSNDQYIVVEEAGRKAAYDSYPTASAPQGAYTMLLDAATGKPYKTVQGTGVVIR